MTTLYAALVLCNLLECQKRAIANHTNIFRRIKCSRMEFQSIGRARFLALCKIEVRLAKERRKKAARKLQHRNEL